MLVYHLLKVNVSFIALRKKDAGDASRYAIVHVNGKPSQNVSERMRLKSHSIKVRRKNLVK